MARRCPQCKTPTFDSHQLASELDVICCTQCHGLFIASARYFAYLSASAGTAIEPRADLPVIDSRELKLCPDCGKFMHYYPVGDGLSFGIDKCNTCGGIWLGAGEWEALCRGNLHRKLHAISSDIWQERVGRQTRAASERAAMLRRLGEEDLAKLESVSAWVQHHPHATEILAYLQRIAPGVRD